MAAPKTKRCPTCDRHFLKGKRALVSGSMRLVCLSCASGAIRVVTTVTKAKCVTRHCNGTAAICQSCAAEQVSEATADPLATPRKALTAMVRALTLVEQREGDSAPDYIRGKLEGLMTGLALLGSD